MSTQDGIKHNEELEERINREFLTKRKAVVVATALKATVARRAAPRSAEWWTETTQQLRADNPTMTPEQINAAAFMLARVPATAAAPAAPPSDPPQPKQPAMCWPTVALALTADKNSAEATWNQIAKQGKFVKDGIRFSLDSKVFAEIIRNFNVSNNKRVPVDFEHASEAPASAGSIPFVGAPAQGWVTRLEMRGGDLYGLIEWNDLARQYIKDGSYRYLSPAVRFGACDRNTGVDIGARLSSVALTNIPFLDGLQPLAASDVPKSFQSAYEVEVAGVKHEVPKPYQTTKRPPRLARDPKNGGIAIIDMGELDTQDKDRLLKSIADFNAEQKKLRDNFRAWAKDSGLNVDLPEEA